MKEIKWRVQIMNDDVWEDIFHGDYDSCCEYCDTNNYCIDGYEARLQNIVVVGKEIVEILETLNKATTYNVNRPDDTDYGIFSGTFDECLDYIKKNYEAGDNENANYHGWQVVECPWGDDFALNVWSIDCEGNVI